LTPGAFFPTLSRYDICPDDSPAPVVAVTEVDVGGKLIDTILMETLE
jgi:hypothetical protein